jgi:hypothetical protein
VWLLRYRNREGRLCRAKATTPQIVRKLRSGRLPEGVEARRPPQSTFQPLTVFPEFRTIRPLRRRAPPNGDPPKAPPETEPKAGPFPPARLLIGLAIAAGVLTAALALRAAGVFTF